MVATTTVTREATVKELVLAKPLAAPPKRAQKKDTTPPLGRDRRHLLSLQTTLQCML
jgi:hypothetical protein